jgi:hypothetical protein
MPFEGQGMLTFLGRTISICDEKESNLLRDLLAQARTLPTVVHVAFGAGWIEISIHMDVEGDVEDVWVVVEGSLAAISCYMSV